jgi:hypothetical protein
MIEFAATYYALNQALMRAEQALIDQDEGALKSATKEVTLASRARDSLEDRLAPEGILAEPILRGKCCVDLRFQWVQKEEPSRVFSQRFSAEFSFE